ncbi:Atp-Dependent Rna Helicase Ddx12-Like [Manis pentadactyla]|nr:Atp-Dependent Rna Helicase Ddx12-Like [Manis pentadactyla]
MGGRSSPASGSGDSTWPPYVTAACVSAVGVAIVVLSADTLANLEGLGSGRKATRLHSLLPPHSSGCQNGDRKKSSFQVIRANLKMVNPHGQGPLSTHNQCYLVAPYGPPKSPGWGEGTPSLLMRAPSSEANGIRLERRIITMTKNPDTPSPGQSSRYIQLPGSQQCLKPEDF